MIFYKQKINIDKDRIHDQICNFLNPPIRHKARVMRHLYILLTTLASVVDGIQARLAFSMASCYGGPYSAD